MKFKVRVALLLIAYFVMTLAGSTHPQQPALAEQLRPTSAPAVGLTSAELVTIASQAHYNTVRLFSDVFESELYGDYRLPWSEVRPQLLKHWAPALVDGELETFYHEHLSDWGYEMGFAFPLWQQEMIEDIVIISGSSTEIVAEFKVPTTYDMSEYVQLRLITISGSWVIASPLVTEAV